MTDEQKASYVLTQVAAALIEAMGMAAANLWRVQQDMDIQYDEGVFQAIITRYGLHHNNIMELFHG